MELKFGRSSYAMAESAHGIRALLASSELKVSASISVTIARPARQTTQFYNVQSALKAIVGDEFVGLMQGQILSSRRLSMFGRDLAVLSFWNVLDYSGFSSSLGRNFSSYSDLLDSLCRNSVSVTSASIAYKILAQSRSIMALSMFLPTSSRSQIKTFFIRLGA